MNHHRTFTQTATVYVNPYDTLDTLTRGTTINQTEAAFKLANALKDTTRAVNMVRPIKGDGSQSLIVSFPDGLFLSVTVEILAQP